MKRLVQLVLLLCLVNVSIEAWAGNKLFVGGLSFGTTSDEVYSLILGIDRSLSVLSVKVKSIDDNGDMSAEAVIRFANEEDVDDAADELDGLPYGEGGANLTARKRVKEIVVVGSKVKEVIREAGLRSDGELVQAVSEKVHEMLEAAIKRTESNKRGTVRPYDL